MNRIALCLLVAAALAVIAFHVGLDLAWFWSIALCSLLAGVVLAVYLAVAL